MNDNYTSQNNEAKQKKHIWIIISAILVVAVFLTGIAVGLSLSGKGEKADYDKKEEKAALPKKKSEKKAKNSVVITFEADKENPTEYEMGIVEAVFVARLNGAGYTEAQISTDDGRITVEIPSENMDTEELDEVERLLTRVASLTFRDADGNIVLDGATDIKNASYEYGQTMQNGAEEPYVKLILKPEAVSKFAKATRDASLRGGEGKDYISIMLDEDVISNPRVRQEINTEECIVTGGFTPESAKMLVNQIKSGQLPFRINAVSKENIAR